MVQTSFTKDEVVDWTDLALDISQLRINGEVVDISNFVSGEPIDFIAGVSTSKQDDIKNRTLIYDLTDDLNSAYEAGTTDKRGVELPSGTMRIDSPTWPTPEGSVFLSAVIKGQGPGKTIFSNANNKTDPGIIIQKGRDIYLSDFSVVGGGNQMTLISAALLKYDYASYVASGFRDSRYSPQCGIAIDAGVSNTPPDGGYPNIQYQNSIGGSSRIIMNNLFIERNVVDLMISPDPSPTSQGDAIRLINCFFQNAKVPLALGQSQTRGVTVQNCVLGWGRTAYDGLEYGQRNAAAPVFYNVLFGGLFECFSHNSGTGPLEVYGGYAESVHRIGQSGTGSSTAPFPVILDGFYFSTGLIDAALPHKCAPVLFESYGPFAWKNGSVINTGIAANNQFIIADYGQLENMLIVLDDRFKPFIGGSIDHNNPISLKNVKVTDSGGAITYGDDDVRRLAISGRASFHWSGGRKKIANTIYEFTPATAYSDTYVNVTSISNWTYGTTSITFDTANPELFLSGDKIYATFNVIGKSAVNTVGLGYRVTGVVSSTVTCDRLFSQDYYSGENNTATSVKIALHYFAPAQALTGDTHTNTTLDNVSPTTILRNGDWITAAAGLVTGFRVASGGGTATITLNKAATDTASGKTIYQGRLNTVGLTPAF